MPKIALPHHFFCPITNDVFKEPVTASDNFVYEKSALTKIFAQTTNGAPRSPMTGAKLPNTIVIPNDELAITISNYLATNKVCSCEEFIQVIKTGTLEELQKLNYLESYLNAEDQEGLTPLHLAAIKGNDALIGFLHGEGAVISCSSTNGMTPLHYVTDTPECTLSMLLVKLGNSPHTPDHRGITPFAKHSKHTVLGPFFTEHCMPKTIEVPEEFLCETSRAIMVEPVKASNGFIYERSVIEESFRALEGNLELDTYFPNKDLIPEEGLKQQITLLREQTKIISLKRFEQLIETGNFSELIRSKIPEYYFHISLNDEPFIFYVAKFGHVEMLSVFLRYADISPRIGNYLERMDTRGRKLLHILSRAGNLCSLRMVLNESLVPKADNVGNTPLHEAVKAGHEAIVAELVKFQTLLDSPDSSGSPALHLAAVAGRVDIAVILLASGATPNSFDKEGMLPVHAAAKAGRLQFVSFWMENFSFTFDTPCKNNLPLILYIGQTETGRKTLVNLLLQDSPEWLKLLLVQYQVASRAFFNNILITILRDFVTKHDLSNEDLQLLHLFLLKLAPFLTISLICDRITCGLLEGDSLLSYLVLIPECLELIPALNNNSLTEEDRNKLSTGLVTIATPAQRRCPLILMSQHQAGLANLSQLFLEMKILPFCSQWLCEVKFETTPLFTLLIKRSKGREFLLQLLHSDPAHANAVTATLLYSHPLNLFGLLDAPGLALLLALYQANEELLMGLSPLILAIHHQSASVLSYFVNDVEVGWQILNLLFKKQPDLKKAIEREYPNLLPILIKYDAGQEQTSNEDDQQEIDEEQHFRELFEAITQQQNAKILSALHFYYRNIKKFKQSPLKYAVAQNIDQAIPTLLDYSIMPENPKNEESVISLGLRLNHFECVLNIIHSRSFHALNLQDLMAIINHMIAAYYQKIMAACVTKWSWLRNCTCRYKETKNTSLIQISLALELDELVNIMLTQDYCVDHANEHNNSSIHFASSATTLNITTVKRVFEKSTNINSQTRSGHTALHLAVLAASTSNRYDIVAALCSFNASKIITVGEEHLVSEIYLRCFTPVHLAICHGKFALFAALLPLTKEEANYSVKIRDIKTKEEATLSPLQLCALVGNEEALQWYIKNVEYGQIKEATGISEQANKILRQKIQLQNGSASSNFFSSVSDEEEKKLKVTTASEDPNNCAP
jgi:ankyrin repeat protein